MDMASQGLTNPWSQTRLRLKNEGASDFQLFLLVGTSGSGNCSHGSITEEVGEVRVMEISLACVELIDIIIEILVSVNPQNAEGAGEGILLGGGGYG